MTFDSPSIHAHDIEEWGWATNAELAPPDRTQLPIPKAELLSQLAAIDRKLKARTKPTPLEKLVVLQYLNRVWRRYLTPQQISVAFYVLDRSIGWGNSIMLASSANVLHGSAEYSGVGMPERTYFRTLTELERIGLLYRKSRRDRTVLGLHLDWQPWS